MRDGRVEQAGTPEEVYLRPASRWMASFLGDIEVLPGEARDGSRALRARQRCRSSCTSTAPCDVLVRPESARRRRQRAGRRGARRGRVAALLRPRPAARPAPAVRAQVVRSRRLGYPGVAPGRPRAGVDRGAGRGPAERAGASAPDAAVSALVRARRGRRPRRRRRRRRAGDPRPTCSPGRWAGRSRRPGGSSASACRRGR